jgi:hypothetical protein
VDSYCLDDRTSAGFLILLLGRPPYVGARDQQPTITPDGVRTGSGARTRAAKNRLTEVNGSGHRFDNFKSDLVAIKREFTRCSGVSRFQTATGAVCHRLHRQHRGSFRFSNRHVPYSRAPPIFEFPVWNPLGQIGKIGFVLRANNLKL